jgi:hypothetical protein
VLYLNALGRAGSQAELNMWVPLLSQPNGQFIVASDIEHSAEARNHLVTDWYLTFLGRKPMGGEQQGLVNQLLSGASEELVLSEILGSNEFLARAQTLAPSGTPQSGFVQALYMLLFNRTPSTAEINAWLATLASQSRQLVALDFLLSGEYRGDLINAYYNVLLHRTSDPVGFAAFFYSGLDQDGLRLAFENSSEFFNNG